MGGKRRFDLTSPPQKTQLFRVDLSKLSEDYNALGTNQTMAFLIMQESLAKAIPQGFLRRGLNRRKDFLLFVTPVLHPTSINMIAAMPTAEISEREFTEYACLSGSVYPDPYLHPNIFEADMAIPLRSNRNVTSDTLPVFANIFQVYIVKLSPTKLKTLKPVGRQRKNRG